MVFMLLGDVWRELLPKPGGYLIILQTKKIMRICKTLSSRDYSRFEGKSPHDARISKKDEIAKRGRRRRRSTERKKTLFFVFENLLSGHRRMPPTIVFVYVMPEGVFRVECGGYGAGWHGCLSSRFAEGQKNKK